MRDTSESVPGVNETRPGQLFDTLGVGAATPPGGDPLDFAGITNRNSNLLKMEKGHRISVDGLYLNMDLDVGAGTFTSVTGYRKQKRSEEHTSELQSLMRISYAVFCLKKKKHKDNHKE